MDNNINISLQELVDASSNIRTNNTIIIDSLNSVEALMNELSSCWLSSGQETLIARFNRFAERFNEEAETIESYAKFLDETVATYDSLESTIVSNAENFN